MKYLIFLLSIFFLMPTTTHAQFLNKLKNRVQDKMERKLEDKLVEELSEEIANRAMKPINKAFDDMFRQAYKEQYGKEYDDSEHEGDPEKQAAMMQALLGSMYGEVTLPEAYDFDYKVKIQVNDFGEKKGHDMLMLVDTKGKAFGMQQNANDEDQLMVFDMEQDQVIIFHKKKKEVMALPNVMKMAKAFGSVEMEEEMLDMTIEKTGKTKKIQGYNSQQYKSKSSEEEGEFYISTELPFDWSDAFGGLMEEMAPNFYKDHPEYDFDGMVLLATSKRKSDGKKSKWEVKDISDSGEHIKCADYKLANIGQAK